MKEWSASAFPSRSFMHYFQQHFSEFAVLYGGFTACDTFFGGNSFVTWVVFFFSFSCQLNMCAGISVSCFKTVHCWHYGYWCKCDTLIVAPVLVTGHLATRCAVHHIYRGYRHSHLGSAGHWERLSNTSHSTFEDSSKARDKQGKYMMHLTNWYLIQLTGIWYNTDVYNTVCRYVIQYTMCSLQLTIQPAGI